MSADYNRGVFLGVSQVYLSKLLVKTGRVVALIKY